MNNEDNEASVRLLGAVVPPNYGLSSASASEANSMSELAQKANEDTAKKIPQYLAVLSALIGALSAGAVFGWSSPAEIRLTNQTEYGFPISKEQWSWVGSTPTLGAAGICAVAGIIANLIGRKASMLILIIPFTIGWGLIIGATNVAMLYVGRVFLGIAGGAFFVVAPIYIGEIAQKDVRGMLGSFFQLNVTIGILFVYVVGYDLSVFVFSIICGVLPLIFGAAFIFMPETPLFLVSKDRNDAACKSLEWLRGKDYDYSFELQELQEQHIVDNMHKAPVVPGMNGWEQFSTNLSTNWTTVKRALVRKATIKAIIIEFGLQIFLQFSGINIVIFYTGSIFDRANSGIKATVATIIVGAMQVVATFIAAMIVDRLGRRILLLFSIFVMAVCKILLGLYFYMSEKDSQSMINFGWLPIFSLCLYIVAFSLGFGPIPWLMIGELFAPDIKGLAGSAAACLSWTLAFVVTKTFSNIEDAIGIGATFWLLAGFSIVGTVFVYFFVPETKGKSLVDIQRMLAGEKLLDTATTASATDIKS